MLNKNLDRPPQGVTLPEGGDGERRFLPLSVDP
jgi:hypothetical protein